MCVCVCVCVCYIEYMVCKHILHNIFQKAQTLFCPHLIIVLISI